MQLTVEFPSVMYREGPEGVRRLYERRHADMVRLHISAAREIGGGRERGPIAGTDESPRSAGTDS